MQRYGGFIMEFMQIFIEVIIGFFALLILTKLVGKTSITQVTAFDFISALVLGELVGNALYDDNIRIGKILFTITLWGTLIYMTEMATQKKVVFRKFFEGKPDIVISKGQIDFKTLKKNHLDLDQLFHLLRKKDVFSIRECQYAILETDGTLSVMKKTKYENVTKADLNLRPNSSVLPVPLIQDGEINYDNLKLIQWDTIKLINEIKSLGVNSPKDVLFAEWKDGEALHIQTY